MGGFLDPARYRFGDLAAGGRVVALDLDGLLDEPPASLPGDVEHERDPVHDAPAGDLPGERALGLHGATGEARERGAGVVRVHGGERAAIDDVRTSS